jgi:nucleotide-binding universal stress UspA family protein
MAIVVGYVPTKEGRAALEAATSEAKLRNTRLVVIHSSHGGQDYDAEEARRYEDALESVRRQLDEAGVEHEERQLVRGKDPSDDLVDVAQELGARLIVIGIRRRTPLAKLVLGSNAQRILLDATCPVLAVKAE